MEEIFNLIEKANLIAEILEAEGKINIDTYGLLHGNISQIDVELRKHTFSEGLDEKSFSNMEKFVNEHINYADSGTIVEELHRRGFKFSENKLFRKEGV